MLSANVPRPLTQCDPPKLDWSRVGAPAATDFDDIYFSTDGGLAESVAVFLRGCGLPEGWQESNRPRNAPCFTIGELGFGSGLNFLATWRLWNQSKPRKGRLHFISVEKFPFDARELGQALSAWPELEHYREQLLNRWPGRVKGFHRLHFGDVTLTLIHDDVQNALDEIDAQVDAWFLDGFNPVKNADMWSDSVMVQIASLSVVGTRLATFTVAGPVRRALQVAGFTVERKVGFGRKRHRLEARYEGIGSHRRDRPDVKVAIIGKGIAGQSLAQAFHRRDITSDIFYDDTPAASGNAAALIKPRFDLQDRPESRFFLAAYLYALNAYEGAIRSQGLTHLATDANMRERFEKLALYASLPVDHLDYDAQKGALKLGRSLVVNPQKFTCPVTDIARKVTRIENIAPGESGTCGYRLHFSDGTGAQDYTHICLAAGLGIRDLVPQLGFRFSRGQVSWAQKDDRLKAPLTYGGYALPLGDNILLGATHDPLTEGEDPFAVNPVDDERNFSQFADINKFALKPNLGKTSRASVRVTTQDTLPLMDEITPRLWVLSGLASRGFVFAPLLSEAIVSDILNEPSPLSRKAKIRFAARKRFK